MLPLMPIPTLVPYNLGGHTDTIPEALAFMVAGLLQKVRTVEEEKSKLQGVINSHEVTIRVLRQEVNELKNAKHAKKDKKEEYHDD